MAKRDAKLASDLERLKTENKADKKPHNDGEAKEGDVKADVKLHERVFLFCRNKKPD